MQPGSMFRRNRRHDDEMRHDHEIWWTPDVTRAKDVGFDAHLTKPLNPQTLAHIILMVGHAI
jgi:hypothetical protein